MKRWILLFISCALIALVRCWNHDQIFVDGRIFFVDADCYSRMTRVAAVVAHPGTILRQHDFENWPDGTTPHTTAPLDYLIATTAALLRNIDFAGAITPILLALGSGLILWRFVGQFRFVTQIAVLFSFAVCPILVHGTVLGRPDHQALLIFLLIGAFASEWELQKAAPPRSAAILNGLAWGFAFWTSLFEPAILFAASFILGIAGQRRNWLTRSRKLSLISMGLVSVFALAIEHWHVGSLPTGPVFDRWAKSIGELAPIGWFSSTYLSWFGLSVLLLPLVFLGLILKKQIGVSLYWGGLFVLTFLLCTTAARWGYFLGIAILFCIPFLLENWKSPWVAALFFLGFWPVASEWDARLWPSAEEKERLAEQREDFVQLRQLSTQIEGGGVIAPWWLTPAIVYWSGAKGVAGSSHQSLPGTEDVARFYLSRFPEKSREIAEQRKVHWIVAYEPSRVLSTSASLLEMPAANDAFAFTLYNQPRRVPSWMKLESETQFFRLYRIPGN